MQSNARTLRILSWGLLAAALSFPAAYGLVRALGAREGPRAVAEDYGGVPDFALVERSGRTVRRSDLAGSFWVANFVFTRCPGICPALSRGMADLEKRIGERARLVSFSVDPANDTPAVLSEYASRFGASPERWLFVTGDASSVRRLVSEGFHLAVAESPLGEKDPAGAITHSDRVALVDRDLRIRRYYRGTDPAWIDELLRDLDALERG